MVKERVLCFYSSCPLVYVPTHTLEYSYLTRYGDLSLVKEKGIMVYSSRLLV